MKQKLLFVCLDCQMTDAIHIEGTESVNEVIALMVAEHKNSCPPCAAQSQKFRLVLKGEAQQSVQRKRASASDGAAQKSSQRLS